MKQVVYTIEGKDGKPIAKIGGKVVLFDKKIKDSVELRQYYRVTLIEKERYYIATTAMPFRYIRLCDSNFDEKTETIYYDGMVFETYDIKKTVHYSIFDCLTIKIQGHFKTPFNIGLIESRFVSIQDNQYYFLTEITLYTEMYKMSVEEIDNIIEKYKDMLDEYALNDLNKLKEKINKGIMQKRIDKEKRLEEIREEFINILHNYQIVKGVYDDSIKSYIGIIFPDMTGIWLTVSGEINGKGVWKRKNVRYYEEVSPDQMRKGGWTKKDMWVLDKKDDIDIPTDIQKAIELKQEYWKIKNG